MPHDAPLDARPDPPEKDGLFAARPGGPPSAGSPERNTGCLHAWIAEVADRQPERIAVRGLGGRHHGVVRTYSELLGRARSLGRRLATLGVGPETLVGVLVERSPDALIALLGVLEAGAAYLPLDPSFPRRRLETMLGSAGVDLVITERDLAIADDVAAAVGGRWVELDEHLDEPLGATAATPLEVEVDADNLAYTIYTSGSTGRPKGVQIPHRAIVNLLDSMRRRPGFGADDVLLSVTTLSFDIAALELFLPLVTGGRVVVADAETAKDGIALRRALDDPELGITAMQATPATWRMLIDAGWQGRPDLKILSGGEALPVDLAARLGRRSNEVWNVYGPTETTVWSTARRVDSDDCMGGVTNSARRRGASVAIGSPIDATSIHVLDRHGAPLPPTAAGELLIGGLGVARGYRHLGALTADRFVPDPFGDGDRLYRTGDLVRRRFDADGRVDLEFVGRIDHQVKVRGFRIELGEIEAVLRDHPRVDDAVVVAPAANPDGAVLTAYIVLRDQPEPADHAESTLRDHLADRLPDYMVPTCLVRLDGLPRTPNGKVDRRALPAPALRSTRYIEPEAGIETALAAIWAEVLEVDRVGRHDHFFHLSGHSLIASRMLSRIRRTLGVEVPMRAVFEHPRLDGLAAAIEAHDHPPEPPLPPLVRVDRAADHLPTSASQRCLWFLDRLSPGSAAYVLCRPLRLRGALDVAALGDAVDALVDRHEALRTTFVDDGDGPLQRIGPADTGHLDFDDLLAHDEPLTAARRRVDAEVRRPFDLARGPIFRARLLRLAADDHVVVLALHHIVADGWSLDLLVDDLESSYRRRAEGRPPARDARPLDGPPLDFADYAAWESRWLVGERLDRQIDFWRRHLAGAPPTLDVPTDRPRPPVVTHDGARVVLAPSPELARDLGRRCRELDATPFLAILAAWSALLARHADQPDLVLGTPIAHRPHPDLESVVGFFANTLPLRVTLDDDPSFASLVDQVRKTALDAFAHQDLPLETLVAELGIERDLSAAPLFQTTLGVDRDATPRTTFAGLSVEPFEPTAPAAAFDLHLAIRHGDLDRDDAHLSAALIYNRDLFDEATIRRLGERFLLLLSQVLADPNVPVGSVDLNRPDDARIQAANRLSVADFPRQATARQLFEQAADHHPAKTAVVYGDTRLTFATVERRANRLAHVLIQRGIGAEDIVGLMLARSAELVVAMVAVAKAGAASVVLGPDDPPARIEQIVDDTAMRLLITTTAASRVDDLARLGRLEIVSLDRQADELADAPEHRPEPRASAENTAYVVYTSGSTGRPKGSLVPSRALARLVRGTPWLEIGADDIVAQTANPSFDAAAWEIWSALANGATLVGFSRNDLVDPRALEARLRREGVTVAFFTTALLHLVARQRPEVVSGLRAVLFGGERCEPNRVRAIRRAFSGRLLHLYGPSECTTYATWYEVSAVDESSLSVPIGGPVSNTEVLVVDRAGRLCPVGVPGELWIGGPGLTHGYLGRPGSTADRFVPHPLGDGLDGPGARLYRTGDRVRLLASGELDFLGRIDRQVKLRGFRIEPAEIEAVLGEHPEVGQALVEVIGDVIGDGRGDDRQRRLVAWVEMLRPDASTVDASTGDRLRVWLEARLPTFMLPSAIVVVDRWPLTANGKIDRRALPVPESRAVAAHRPPATPIERLIAEIWQDVLHLDTVPGRDDDFFRLGGHSLLAVQIISRLRAASGLEMSVRQVFDHPDLATFAATTESALAATADGRETLEWLDSMDSMIDLGE